MSLPVLAPMTPEDLDDIMPLERQVFADPWTRRMYLTDLTDNPMATYRVLRPPPPTGDAAGQAGDRDWPAILAWGGYWLMVDEAHIATVASHPGWRGCGLGQWLMLALIHAAEGRGAQRVTLEVRASNLVAQQLYEKLGFAVAGRRRRYYRDGEDGLIMTTPPLREDAMRARLAAAVEDGLARLRTCFGAGAGGVRGGRFVGEDRSGGQGLP